MNGTANDSERRGGGKRGGGGRVLFVVQPPFSQIGDRPTADIKTYKFRKRRRLGASAADMARIGKHLNLLNFRERGKSEKVFCYIVFSEVFFSRPGQRSVWQNKWRLNLLINDQCVSWGRAGGGENGEKGFFWGGAQTHFDRKRERKGGEMKEMRQNWKLEKIYTCPVIFFQSADFSIFPNVFGTKNMMCVSRLQRIILDLQKSRGIIWAVREWFLRHSCCWYVEGREVLVVEKYWSYPPPGLCVGISY